MTAMRGSHSFMQSAAFGSLGSEPPFAALRLDDRVAEDAVICQVAFCLGRRVRNMLRPDQKEPPVRRCPPQFLCGPEQSLPRVTNGSIGLGILAPPFGILFFAPYLLYLVGKSNGDPRKILLGVHA